MLRVTPYIWMIVFIVGIGGLWFPVLGYVMAVVMLTLMIITVFRERWFCGNLCPRGSLYDYTVSKMSQNRNVPSILSSYRVRIPVFVVTMGFMTYRLATALGTQDTFDNIGTVLASMCVTMTIIFVSMGIYLKPRAWCAICPMGTLQRIVGGSKYQLKMTQDKCIDCKLCEKKCPMDLEVRNIGNNPDCIKCGRCVVACPKPESRLGRARPLSLSRKIKDFMGDSDLQSESRSSELIKSQSSSRVPGEVGPLSLSRKIEDFMGDSDLRSESCSNQLGVWERIADSISKVQCLIHSVYGITIER